ncbi:MAG: DUF885 domain-containing protein [Pseudomonadota bacterium]
MNSKVLLPLVAALLLTACGASESTSETDHSADLAQLFDDYFEDFLVLSPISATANGDDRYDDQYANSIGPEHRAAVKNLHAEYLSRLELINFDALSYQEQLSYEMFKYAREMSLEGLEYPGHLMPMNHYRSAMTSFVSLGSGAGLHPFKTVKNYDDFLARVDGFVVYVDQAIENMRAGMQQGYVVPSAVMTQFRPQLESQMVASAGESGFYAPITNMPDDFNDADRERLTAAYVDAIENKIVPAYQRMHHFVSDEYIGATRDSVGQLDLPNGDEWYAYNARLRTTTDLTPDEIHQIGLDEVARIHGEMRNVMVEVGFDGDLNEFFIYVNSDPDFFYDEPEQLIQAYRDMSAHIEDLSTKLFKHFPATGFEVRAVEAYREKTSSKGSYRAGLADGTRPGVFYANTYNVGTRPKWDMQSLYLHEAIPGHHFQISLQRENEELPRFRRFGGFTAYSEGWGLYAESLGKEIGVYTDPMDYFGALNAELWRSIRLVVDTGIHAKGWTRQQVLDFMYANSAVSETRAVAEAERFISWPGQALAYKIGMLKIREIRAGAEAQLGERFDVQEFHNQVLKDGAMPLSMLEAKIQRWIDATLEI